MSSVSEDDMFEVEKIVDVRTDSESGRRVFRVRWKGCPPEEDTWEPKKNLYSCTDLLEKFKEERRLKKERRQQKKAQEGDNTKRQESNDPCATVKTEPSSPDKTSETIAPEFPSKFTEATKNTSSCIPVRKPPAKSTEGIKNAPPISQPAVETHKNTLPTIVVATSANATQLATSVENTATAMQWTANKRKRGTLDTPTIVPDYAGFTRRQRQEMERAVQESKLTSPTEPLSPNDSTDSERVVRKKRRKKVGVIEESSDVENVSMKKVSPKQPSKPTITTKQSKTAEDVVVTTASKPQTVVVTAASQPIDKPATDQHKSSKEVDLGMVEETAGITRAETSIADNEQPLLEKIRDSTLEVAEKSFDFTATSDSEKQLPLNASTSSSPYVPLIAQLHQTEAVLSSPDVTVEKSTSRPIINLKNLTALKTKFSAITQSISKDATQKNTAQSDSTPVSSAVQNKVTTSTKEVSNAQKTSSQATEKTQSTKSILSSIFSNIQLKDKKNDCNASDMSEDMSESNKKKSENNKNDKESPASTLTTLKSQENNSTETPASNTTKPSTNVDNESAPLIDPPVKNPVDTLGITSQNLPELSKSPLNSPKPLTPQHSPSNSPKHKKMKLKSAKDVALKPKASPKPKNSVSYTNSQNVPETQTEKNITDIQKSPVAPINFQKSNTTLKENQKQSKSSGNGSQKLTLTSKQSQKSAIDSQKASAKDLPKATFAEIPVIPLGSSNLTSTVKSKSLNRTKSKNSTESKQPSNSKTVTGEISRSNSLGAEKNPKSLSRTNSLDKISKTNPQSNTTAKLKNNASAKTDKSQKNADKSRKLTYKEYVAKKQTEQDAAPFIDFMRLPSSSSSVNTNADNAVLLPQKQKPMAKQAVPEPKVRHPQPESAGSEDVLTNIIGNGHVEIRKETETSEEDIILEDSLDERLEDESDFDLDDLDEYSGDEDGLLMPSSTAPRKTIHSEYPTANTKSIDMLVVHQAIMVGDLSTVVESRITNINTLVDDMDTLLMKSVMECSPSMVRAVLEKGADPNVPSMNEKTPLMFAVELQQRSLVVLLIQHGAKLNTQTGNGESALVIACKMGYLEIVHILLNSGADFRPASAFLEKTTSVSKHLRPTLVNTLHTHFEKLKALTEGVFHELAKAHNKLELKIDRQLLACRCISPYELEEHDFYFNCDAYVRDKRVQVLLLALPVNFERNGCIIPMFGNQGNGINDVLLNNDSMIQALPNNRLLYFLYPTFGEVNMLKIRCDLTFRSKILVCVYSFLYGKNDQRNLADPRVPKPLMTSSVKV